MSDIMSKKSREKIALLVFLGLIVLSLCGLGWYLFAGHSWNVAASNLDDTFGSMEGYTAIVYPGTAPVADASASGEAAGATSGKQAADGGAAEQKDSGGRAAESPEVPETAGASEASKASSGTPDSAASTGATSPSTESSTASAGTSSKGAGDGSLSSKKKTLEAAEAKKGYEDKGATVFSLDTTDLGSYAEGIILKKGGHRFGVFSIEEPTSTILLEKQIAYFKRHKVDFIVAITPDKEYVDGVVGIDIAVSTQDEDLFVMGETIDGTFYVDAPTVGSVGAILISPSNVVSAKVLQAS